MGAEGRGMEKSWVLQQETAMKGVVGRGARSVLDICKCIYF